MAYRANATPRHAGNALYEIAELSEMILKKMLPTGQVYTYDGFGENFNYPALPFAIDTNGTCGLLEELMQVWLGQNHFFLLAQASFSQLHRVSSNSLVYKNDLDASIRWIATMAKFQPKIDITLQYVSTTSVHTTRALWADFPAFLRLIELAFEYDMLLTVNGRRAQHQAPVAANYRGVDIRFVNHTNEQALLLQLIERSNVGKMQGWNMARLKTELAALLNRHHCSTTNSSIWEAVKRIRLPCDIEAFLGPHNLLYKTPRAALAAIQAVNSGKQPDIACFDRVWCMSLAVALEKWNSALKKQLETFNNRIPTFNSSLLHDTRFDCPIRIFPLGQKSVFGLYGDENLVLVTPDGV
ncbi:hypothetical protein MBLNU13_g07125t2 [Cladosporium sp. NU13]